MFQHDRLCLTLYSMRALLNQEIDMEELFEYNEAEEDQEFSTQGTT